MNADWSSNPFSTRFVSPGQLSFIGMEEGWLDELAAVLIQQNGNGQIVGPHGVGKTTLSFELERRVARLNDTRTPFRFVRKIISPQQTIRSGHQSASFESSPQKTVLVLDGFERLSWFQRVALVKACQRKQIGLLLTTHRAVWGVPKLVSLKPDQDRFESVVKELTCDCEFQISRECLAEIFANNNGNIHESLMSCYDEFEANRAKPDEP